MSHSFWKRHDNSQHLNLSDGFYCGLTLCLQTSCRPEGVSVSHVTWRPDLPPVIRMLQGVSVRVLRSDEEVALKEKCVKLVQKSPSVSDCVLLK